MRRHKLEMIPVDRCQLLERNPQYLTPRQMDALKQSIERDGFVAPILARPKGKVYEIVSGNHRFMGAKELGYKEVPAVVAKLSDGEAKRLAINLNLIHGEPTAEQLAPFLADLDDDVLEQIHLDGRLLDDVLAFDATLKERLAQLQDVPGLDAESVNSPIGRCKCPTCGKDHIASK